METSGSQCVPVSPMQTWLALTDPAVLKVCVPRCQSMVKVSDTEYHLVMGARIGPVTTRFKGRLLLSHVNAPRAYRLTFEGRGGVAGFVSGSADVTLVAEEADSTRLTYAVQAHVGGRLARIGSRFIDAAAKKLADQFFSTFAAQLGNASAP